MNLQLQQNQSFWQGTDVVPQYPTLEKDTSADVCIVGSGIAGLTTAYFLAQEGKKVIVLSESAVGGGESMRTTAHLSNAIDSGYLEIERLHGQEGSRLVAQSHTAAINLIESICKKENIHCGFERVDGYLFNSDAVPTINLEEEIKAVHRAGLQTVKLRETFPIWSLSLGPCIHYPLQAQFNPLKYLIGLARSLKSLGVEVYTNSRVVNVTDNNPLVVYTAKGPQVSANSLVVAANAPILGTFALNTKQSAYRSYVFSFLVPNGGVPKGLFWDTADPYHYLRTYFINGREYLMVGGEDHRTGQSQDETAALTKLEDWVRKHFPGLGKPLNYWSGQIEESVDGLAFIGHYPFQSRNVFVATGDCGMGMTHGTIAGRLLTDLIVGRDTPWEKIYSPSRLTFSAIAEWTSENLNTMMQYTDYFKRPALESVEDLGRGDAAVLGSGLNRIATYRDNEGNLTQLSAVCPHLGGIVHWNKEENTWDCPCHGSRFSPNGRVLNGPAVRDLAPASLPVAESQEVGSVVSFAR